jgi:DNA-binding transcriptional ArsR family regulator
MSTSHNDVWSALASPLRRRILDVLSLGPAGTGAIVAALGADRHVVMQHLRVLRKVDLIRVEPRGRERLNHLNPVPLQDAVGRWISRYEQDWAAALVGLRDTVEAAAAERPAAPADTRHTDISSSRSTFPSPARRTRGA